MSKTTSDSQSSSSFKNDSLSSDSANQCVPIFNWMSHLFIDEDVGIEDEENCCIIKCNNTATINIGSDENEMRLRILSEHFAERFI